MSKTKLTVVKGGRDSDYTGTGPEDPMIEQRVARLEDDMKEVKSSLKTIEAAVSEIKHLPKMSDYAALKADVSEMKGKLSNMPTTWTILGIVFTTWALGSGLLIWTLTNLIKK